MTGCFSVNSDYITMLKPIIHKTIGCVNLTIGKKSSVCNTFFVQ